ncbi:MAG: phasin family protein [Alphaproteobacteria bacterium]|nr:phasin family protein [Alphaproteobacteria bacterium]
MPDGKSTPPPTAQTSASQAQASEQAQHETNSSSAGEQLVLDGMNDFFDLNVKGTEALVRSSEALFTALESVGREIIDFADQRMRAVTDITQSVVKCNTWAEAYEMQAKHARSTLEAYTAEARTLLDLSAKASKEGLVPLEEHARTSLRL